MSPVTFTDVGWNIFCSDGTQLSAATAFPGAFTAAVGATCTVAFNVTNGSNVIIPNAPPSPPHAPSPPGMPPPPGCIFQGLDYK
eukprot:1905975-Prymnesium_polylepis.1